MRRTYKSISAACLAAVMALSSMLYGCSGTEQTEAPAAALREAVDAAVEEISDEALPTEAADAPDTEAQPDDTVDTVPDEVLTAEDYYKTALSLTKSDLTQEYSIGDFIIWEYNGISLTYEDCEFVNAGYNTKELVNQGALYRALAESLERLIDLDSQGQKIKYSDDAEVIFGYSPESQEEFISLALVANGFICTEEPVKSVMAALESLKCSEGVFDYDGNVYEFSLSDISACAEELNISEETMGYILAVLSEFGAEIIFADNACDATLAVKTYESLLS